MTELAQHISGLVRANFWAKVNKTENCWLWIGAKSTAGYGYLGIGKRKNAPAHRVSWVIEHGTIDSQLFVCHRCDNPGCVNPGHLFLGTHKDNMNDMAVKGRSQKGRKRPSESGNTKLNIEKVRDIRSLFATGKYTKTALGQMFGVTRANIGYIVENKSWIGRA